MFYSVILLNLLIRNYQKKNHQQLPRYESQQASGCPVTSGFCLINERFLLLKNIYLSVNGEEHDRALKFTKNSTPCGIQTRDHRVASQGLDHYTKIVTHCNVINIL